jgi:hypothetical protein
MLAIETSSLGVGLGEFAVRAIGSVTGTTFDLGLMAAVDFLNPEPIARETGLSTAADAILLVAFFAPSVTEENDIELPDEAPERPAGLLLVQPNSKLEATMAIAV